MLIIAGLSLFVIRLHHGITLLDLNDDLQNQLLFKFNLPRVLTAVLTGGALGIAGLTYQALLHNPLAGPYTLGASSGSALAIMLCSFFGVTSFGSPFIGAIAIAGACVLTALVWRFAAAVGSPGSLQLILGGIVLSLFCSAVIVLLQFLANQSELGQMVRWLMGSLDWVPTTLLLAMGIVIVTVAFVLSFLTRHLDALSMGKELSQSVGVDAEQTTIILLFLTALLVGASVALAGPLAFIGLIIPHMVRPLFGHQHKHALFGCAVLGASLLLLCDTFARLTILGGIPVGIVTGILGGVFFLGITLRRNFV